MSVQGKKVVIIGGTSGIGLATAKAAIAAGAEVVIASRSAQKLATAKADIGCKIDAQTIDLMAESSIHDFFQNMGQIDHLVISAGSVKTGPIRELAFNDAVDSMTSKFWGPYLAAKYAQVNPDTSITLFSGILSRRPSPGFAALASINAAVEGLGRALALELAPVRVNVISPGLVETPVYEGMPPAQRQAYFESMAKQLPVKRIGTPEDIAATVLHLMQNGYTTGTVVDVDGGSLLI